MASNRTIHTFTGNLLAEYTFTHSDWREGKTQRATTSTFQVGGKGINVSKMLNRLGTANVACCIPGGSTGEACARWLEEHAFRHKAFPTQTATRLGLVVRKAGHSETTFLGPDAPVDAKAFQEAATYLESLPENDVVALCGSIPGWTTENAAPLRRALSERAQRGSVYVDTYGPPLGDLVQLPVALVKINRDEFELLSPTSLPDLPFEERLDSFSQSSPVKAWVITDGPGRVFSLVKGNKNTVHTPPLVQEVSATGSGDVFFAALLNALLFSQLSLKEAVNHALPYGAANAASAGIADFDLNLVASLRSHLP